MLIRFTIENHLSFGKPAEFSTQATRELHHRARTFQTPIRGLRLLPITAIYGPNASGKSNLFKALKLVRDLVINGTRPGESTGAQPFRLDRARMGQPSRFEIEFLVGDKAFAYRFVATSQEVIEESLWELHVASKRLFFSRELGAAGSTYKFGPASGIADDEKERQFLEFVGKGTRTNQLFLHEALDRGVKQLNPVLDWFGRTLVLICPRSSSQSLELNLHEHQEFKNFCNHAVQRIDAGIESLDTEFASLGSAALSEEIKDMLRKQMTETENVFLRASDGQRYNAVMHEGEIQVAKIVSYHRGSDGKKVRFEIPEESEGTQRFIDLLPAFHDLGISGSEKVIFVDELDRSFHTRLTQTLIESYLAAWHDKSRTQLLFTTHDATPLDQDLFRRDEVALVEKSDEGETELQSLSDYRVRSDKRLMKDYLLGRYGAVPRTQTLRLRRLPVEQVATETAVD
ncbi:MAG: ATP/GTP-binding protein [Verrucomicrobiota bacterium]